MELGLPSCYCKSILPFNILAELERIICARVPDRCVLIKITEYSSVEELISSHYFSNYQCVQKVSDVLL